MVFKIAFILIKRHLKDAEGIESFVLFETERTKVVGKGAFSLAVLGRHNGEEVVVKEVIFFFYLGFFSQTFTNRRTVGEGEGISLTHHPLHRNLDITGGLLQRAHPCT